MASGRRAKILMAAALLFLGAVVTALPVFFGYVEQRSGVVLNDPVLNLLPSGDYSIVISLLLYGSLAWFVRRSVQEPKLLPWYLWAYAIMVCLRMACMWAAPLDPPVGYVSIRDPIQQLFYGGQVITKDLFFSGHTATVLMAALILPGRQERRWLMAATACLALLLLSQRVHYSVDVLAAIPAAWLSVRAAKSIIGE